VQYAASNEIALDRAFLPEALVYLLLNRTFKGSTAQPSKTTHIVIRLQVIQKFQQREAESADTSTRFPSPIVRYGYTRGAIPRCMTMHANDVVVNEAVCYLGLEFSHREA
jgi:hypothetical protein